MLKAIVDKAPNIFPQDRRDFMLATINAFEENVEVAADKIETAIADFGKEIWPYRKAFEKIYLDKFHPDLSQKEIIDEDQLSNQDQLKEKAEEYIADNQDEFNQLKFQYEKERVLIEDQINVLRQLAKDYPEQAAEINGSVAIFEESFSIAEPDVDINKVEKKIEYYRDRLGLV